MKTEDLINELRDKRDYYYNIANHLRDTANLLEEEYLAVQRESE